LNKDVFECPNFDQDSVVSLDETIFNSDICPSLDEIEPSFQNLTNNFDILF
jgi:hypothetical protein